jgi:hypothetical protein
MVVAHLCKYTKNYFKNCTLHKTLSPNPSTAKKEKKGTLSWVTFWCVNYVSIKLLSSLKVSFSEA